MNMAKEYGVITNEMTEKQLVTIISKRIEDFFRENATKSPEDEEAYTRYANHKLRKHKNPGGESYNPEAIEWDYEYQYDYFNKAYGAYLELYPNTNKNGDCKYKIDGVEWNLYVNGIFWETWKEGMVHPTITKLLPFVLEGIPCEKVLIREYAHLEDRL